MEENGQKCTPLLIAARNGKDKVVKMLLYKFKPDIEQDGDVKFDGYLIEGATPLWCAAGNLMYIQIRYNNYYHTFFLRCRAPESG